MTTAQDVHPTGPATPELAVEIAERYVGLADAAVHDPAALDELLTLFAPDASVLVTADLVSGHEAISAFYREFVGHGGETKHLWVAKALPDGSAELTWGVVRRTEDQRIITASGVEVIVVNSAGLITSLRNTHTRQPG